MPHLSVHCRTAMHLISWFFHQSWCKFQQLCCVTANKCPFNAKTNKWQPFYHVRHSRSRGWGKGQNSNIEYHPPGSKHLRLYRCSQKKWPLVAKTDHFSPKPITFRQKNSVDFSIHFQAKTKLRFVVLSPTRTDRDPVSLVWNAGPPCNLWVGPPHSGKQAFLGIDLLILLN